MCLWNEVKERSGGKRGTDMAGRAGGTTAQSLREEGPAHGGHSINTCEMMKCGEDLTVDT